LLHGRVLWKGTETVVPGVALRLEDESSGQVVLTGNTDATGWYTLTVGVGSWLLNIPATARYYGYAQEVTVLPHGEYMLDFAISPRPAGELTPPAGPTAPPQLTAGAASGPTANLTPA